MTEPLAVLQRIRQGRQAAPPPVPGERCDLCAEGIGEDHGHVVDLEGRRLLCTCRACYLLFTAGGAGGGHYRAVPDRYEALGPDGLHRGEWEALEIPVSVAFFFLHSGLDRVAAFYPGPAGATESLLSLDTWATLTERYPVLATMAPDIEALLVRIRPDRAASSAYVVPIDVCYELVGRLRQLWEGFDGGPAAAEAMDGFFERVEQRCR